MLKSLMSRRRIQNEELCVGVTFCFKNLPIYWCLLETTDIKHLYFGTKWPWTLASQNSRHCTVQSLGSPRTGPRSFAVLVFFVLRCWSERSQEQLNQLLSTWMLLFCSFQRRIDTKMIRRQKWLILMDVSCSCWTCSWPSLNFGNPKAGTTGSCLNINKIGHPWIDRNQAFNNLEPRTRDSRKDHVDFASVVHLLISLILEYPDTIVTYTDSYTWPTWRIWYYYILFWSLQITSVSDLSRTFLTRSAWSTDKPKVYGLWPRKIPLRNGICQEMLWKEIDFLPSTKSKCLKCWDVLNFCRFINPAFGRNKSWTFV